MRPWEEEWTTGRGNHWGRGVRVAGTSDSRAWCGQMEQPLKVALFIAAAPDMARALIGLLDTTKQGVLTQDKCDAARASLRKAGVIE